MEMKCRKEVRGILLGLCMLFLVIGCRNAITEEESAAPQEIEGGAIVNEENGEKEDGDVLVGDYEYCFLEDESAKILKYTGNAPVVFLPEKLEGKKVSVIGESAFQNNGQINQVVFPTGIAVVEDRAFEGCVELQYAFLNAGVREIGYRAFGGCLNLEEITFPEGMTDIGSGIFEGCIGLKKIVLPQSMSSIDEDAFAECTELQLVYGDSEFAKAYAEKEGKIYVDFNRIREEGSQVW